MRQGRRLPALCQQHQDVTAAIAAAQNSSIGTAPLPARRTAGQTSTRHASDANHARHQPDVHAPG